MGYRFNQQVCFASFFILLLTKFGWITLFQCVMPMAMENLTIAQNWNILDYVLFKEVVIKIEIVDLSHEIVCMYNKQH
jgi:hypothetical protein